MTAFYTATKLFPELPLFPWLYNHSTCPKFLKIFKGLSQMQIIEHLRQLFLYDLSQKGTEKEKKLKMRQKRGRQKEDRENPYF